MTLKELRELNRFSQEQLAEMVGCSRSTIAAIEVGNMQPSISMAKKLGEALEIDWATLYPDED